MLQSTRQLRETKGQKQNLFSGNKEKRVYHFRFSQAKTMTATRTTMAEAEAGAE
jgi:hypothetical protein